MPCSTVEESWQYFWLVVSRIRCLFNAYLGLKNSSGLFCFLLFQWFTINQLGFSCMFQIFQPKLQLIMASGEGFRGVLHWHLGRQIRSWWSRKAVELFGKKPGFSDVFLSSNCLHGVVHKRLQMLACGFRIGCIVQPSTLQYNILYLYSVYCIPTWQV